MYGRANRIPVKGKSAFYVRQNQLNLNQWTSIYVKDIMMSYIHAPVAKGGINPLIILMERLYIIMSKHFQ